MKDALIRLLKVVEAAVPPPPKCHHALMYAEYGSDVSGWEEKLAIQVNFGGVFHAFFLVDDDINKPDETAKIIADCLKAKDEHAQTSTVMTLWSIALFVDCASASRAGGTKPDGAVQISAVGNAVRGAGNSVPTGNVLAVPGFRVR